MHQRSCLFCERPVRNAPAVCRNCCLRFDWCKLEIVFAGKQLALCKTEQATLWRAYYVHLSTVQTVEAFQSLNIRVQELNLIYETRIAQLETTLLCLAIGMNPFNCCLGKAMPPPK